MNLISCETCGTVFNKDNLSFPPIWDDTQQERIKENSEWDSEIYDYVACIDCPVCGENWGGKLYDMSD